MQITRPGFSLFEFLIYLTLFSFIALASSSWMCNTWQTFLKKSKQYEEFMCILCACDNIRKDIMHAQSIVTCTKHLLIVAHDNYHIGYEYTKGTLYRIKGIFDPKKIAWKSAQKNILGSFDIIFKQNDRRVECIIGQPSQSCAVVTYISPKTYTL